MSVEALGLVLNARIDNPSKKAVLLGLANHSSPSGKNIFPSVKRLSIYTGLSDSTVRSKLAELRKDKLIEVVRKAYRYRPTEYKMDLTKLRDMRHPGLLELEASSEQTSEKPISDLLETDIRPLAPRGKPLINPQVTLKDLKDSKTSKKSKPKKPRKRDPLFDAIADVCQVDPKTAGSSIAKIRHVLADAGYTPEHIYAFQREWKKEKWRHKPPSLWQLREQIGIVKTLDARSREEKMKAESTYGRKKRRRTNDDVMA